VNPWASAERLRWVFVGSLVVAIVASATLLVSVHPNKFWTVALQVVGVLAGAALGNALTRDHSRSLMNQQAGGAIRRLVDQATRMGTTAVRLENQGDELRADPSASQPERIADWLTHAATDLRNEIGATASAIEDWGSLAPEIRDDEVKKFKERKNRLPLWQEDGADG